MTFVPGGSQDPVPGGPSVEKQHDWGLGLVFIRLASWGSPHQVALQEINLQVRECFEDGSSILVFGYSDTETHLISVMDNQDFFCFCFISMKISHKL